MPRENVRFSKRVMRVKSYRPMSGVIDDSGDGGWRCGRREETDDRFRQQLNQVLQDPGFKGPEIAGYDKVAQSDHQRKEQHQAEKREDPDPDGGPAFSGESLANGVAWCVQPSRH